MPQIWYLRNLSTERSFDCIHPVWAGTRPEVAGRCRRSLHLSLCRLGEGSWANRAIWTNQHATLSSKVSLTPHPRCGPDRCAWGQRLQQGVGVALGSCFPQCRQQLESWDGRPLHVHSVVSRRRPHSA